MELSVAIVEQLKACFEKEYGWWPEPSRSRMWDCLIWHAKGIYFQARFAETIPHRITWYSNKRLNMLANTVLYPTLVR